jgi:PAS domain S-box-containing protein
MKNFDENKLEKAGSIENNVNASIKQIKKAFLESEEKYRTLTKNIPLGIFRSTPGAKGRFIEVNSAFIKMLDYLSEEELLKIDVTQIYQNPKDRIRFSKKVSEEGAVKNEELYLKKKDGTPIIASVTAVSVCDTKGKVQCFAGIVEDITTRKKNEQEFLVQKTYFERLYNSAPEAIVLHDNNDHVADINAEFTKMFGYTREEAIGKPINDLVANEEVLSEAAMISEKVIRGERIDLDTKRKRKDGTLMDVSILGAPIVHDGKQLGDYAIYRDITERKKAEEELRIQKSYLEELFNSAPEAIVWHDSNDIVVNVNVEFTKLFGYLREEAIGKPINELLAPEQLQDEASKFSSIVINGERVEAESKRKCKDGRLVDVSILGAPIFHGNEQIGVFAIYRDISERKKSEDQLLIQKTYLEELFNSAPEAIVWHDTNDLVVSVNDEFTKLFGYTREEAFGKSINDLVAPEQFRDEASQLSNMVINGERVEAESQRKRKDGTLIDVSILGAPIFHEKEQMGVYAIYRDITEQKKAQEARIRLKEEARMARNIQMNFLPKSNPAVPGYDIAGKSIPAMNVGGDYYDFIFLDNSRLAIGLGDVSGNGLAAALVMANLQATIRGQALADASPEKCLEMANKLLFRSTDSRTFVTLFYGILDYSKHTFSYANAGQDLPILLSHGSNPVELKINGLALGMTEDATYQSQKLTINPGDKMLIYSDGIHEAMNERKEQFGIIKLQHILSDNRKLSSGKLIKKIFEVVHSHFENRPQIDDMSMVLLTRENG